MNMNNDWLQVIEAGDEVIVYSGYRIVQFILKVERITKTQVILVSGGKYRKDDGRSIGTDAWSTKWLREATPEVIKAIKVRTEKIKVVNVLSQIEFKNISLETLKKIQVMIKDDPLYQYEEEQTRLSQNHKEV